jgi:hypothetical protein
LRCACPGLTSCARSGSLMADSEPGSRNARDPGHPQSRLGC